VNPSIGYRTAVNEKRRCRRWNRLDSGSNFPRLRHYFATSLITAGADPTDVQRALRHAQQTPSSVILYRICTG
jgi:integrase